MDSATPDDLLSYYIKKIVFMDNLRFLAIMNDGNADINLVVSKENLMAFADQLITRAREELAAKAEQEQRQKTNEETLLTRKEACAYLGVCETTLWNWAKSDVGYLLPVRVGSKVMYRKSDLDRIKSGGKKITDTG